MIHSFQPIEPKYAEILILGTMPSVRSLEKQQYYGHPQNSFWPLIFALWGRKAPVDYRERVTFLKAKNIALWDVLQNCEREGSLDSNIKDPQPNDIVSLLCRHPELKTIFFNSTNAQKLFERLVKKQIANEDIQYVTLPSSSPARAMRFEDKLAHWQAVCNCLQTGQS